MLCGSLEQSLSHLFVTSKGPSDLSVKDVERYLQEDIDMHVVGKAKEDDM